MLRLLPLTRFLHFRPPLLQARKLKKALAQNAAQANQMKAVAACASLQRCTRLTSGLTCPRPSTPPLTTTLKTSLAQPVFSSLQPQVRGIRAANAWKRDDQRLVLARKRAKAGRRGNQDTGHVQCRQRTKKARSSHQPPKRSVRRWRIWSSQRALLWRQPCKGCQQRLRSWSLMARRRNAVSRRGWRRAQGQWGHRRARMG